MMHSKVTEVMHEKGEIFTIMFNSEMKAMPGQFLMIWVPGLKEIPMSLSQLGDPFAITFRVYGETTKALSLLKKDDLIFYRGPYGNSYPTPEGQIAYIAGGTGMASLKSMINKFSGDVYVGARNLDELFFVKDGYYVATDDGSSGFKGTVVELFINQKKEYDYVFVCGPEAMMKSFLDRVSQSAKTKVFMSLERLMKCGIGICDSCSINGYRVCKDGTVFNATVIRKMSEFGVSRRSESGKLHFLLNNKE